jgi:hypothetical protein
MTTRRNCVWVEALVTLIPLFVTLSACGNSGPIIPNGAYMTADMKEAITVEGPRIHFKVLAGEDGARMIDRSCEYSVWPMTESRTAQSVGCCWRRAIRELPRRFQCT